MLTNVDDIADDVSKFLKLMKTNEAQSQMKRQRRQQTQSSINTTLNESLTLVQLGTKEKQVCDISSEFYNLSYVSEAQQESYGIPLDAIISSQKNQVITYKRKSNNLSEELSIQAAVNEESVIQIDKNYRDSDEELKVEQQSEAQNR